MTACHAVRRRRLKCRDPACGWVLATVSANISANMHVRNPFLDSCSAQQSCTSPLCASLVPWTGAYMHHLAGHVPDPLCTMQFAFCVTIGGIDAIQGTELRAQGTACRLGCRVPYERLPSQRSYLFTLSISLSSNSKNGRSHDPQLHSGRQGTWSRV
jgi:hypothetical protein